MFKQNFMAYYLLNLTITNVTLYLHHKFSTFFLLYVVTKLIKSLLYTVP